MGTWTTVVGWFCGGLLLGATALAAPDADQVNMTLDLRQSHWQRAPQVTGKIRYPAPNPVGYVCFYLPFNDPDYEWDPGRGFLPNVETIQNVERLPGKIQVKAARGYVPLEAHLIKVPVTNGQVELFFNSELPRWPERRPPYRFYQDFYPIPLRQCPLPSTSAYDYSEDKDSTWNIEIRRASFDQVLTPAELTATPAAGVEQFTFASGRFSFVIGRNLQTETIQRQHLTIVVLKQSAYMNTFVPLIEPLMVAHERYLLDFPLSRLLIVETEDLMKSRVPGVITMNRPRQTETMGNALHWIHWGEWQLAYYLAEQWIGVAVGSSQARDYWLCRGLADFVAYQSLKTIPEIWNFFAPLDDGDPWLELNFAQADELMAYLLTYSRQRVRLTNQDLMTADDMHLQHGLSYVRHTLALRYLNWFLGEEPLRDLINDLVANELPGDITPKLFWQYVADVNESGAQYLRQWWTSNDWPDFTLDHVTKTESSTLVYVGQASGLALPINVELTDKEGKKWRAIAEPIGETWIARFPVMSGIERIEIHPEREVFDWNRFNNRSDGTRIQFFPGNAQSFIDDGYTVLWAPFFAKLPGEDFKWLLGTQVFHYLHSSATAVVSYTPHTARMGFRLLYLADFPQFDAYTVSNAQQDFALSSERERLLEIGVYRQPVLFTNPRLELGIRARWRELMDRPREQHSTLTLRANLASLKERSCQYEIQADTEATVPENRNIAYRKHLVRSGGSCGMGSYAAAGRMFVGWIERQGAIPDNVAFRPQDTDGARMRMDAPRLPASDQIASLGLEVLGPARLPVSSYLFAMPRESRWKVFYDYAQTLDLNGYYADAGVGMHLPFGGDAVGKSSMTFMRLTVLAVLFKRVNDEIEKKPGLMVDFLGNL